MMGLPQLQTRAASYMGRVRCKHFSDGDGWCAYHRAILGALVPVEECPALLTAELALRVEREANRLVLQDHQANTEPAMTGGR